MKIVISKLVYSWIIFLALLSHVKLSKKFLNALLEIFFTKFESYFVNIDCTVMLTNLGEKSDKVKRII